MSSKNYDGVVSQIKNVVKHTLPDTEFINVMVRINSSPSLFDIFIDIPILKHLLFKTNLHKEELTTTLVVEAYNEKVTKNIMTLSLMLLQQFSVNDKILIKIALHDYILRNYKHVLDGCLNSEIIIKNLKLLDKECIDVCYPVNPYSEWIKLLEKGRKNV